MVLKNKKLPNNKNEVTVEASFAPRGIGGHLYWWAVKPFHTFVFPTMIVNLIKASIRRDYAEKNASI